MPNARCAVGKTALAAVVGVGLLLLLAPATASAQDAPTSEAETSTTTEPTQSVRGRLRHGDDPVAGVGIVVTRGGDQIGEATTAEDGTWEVGVPQAGSYTVSVDVDSLPEGIGLRREGENEREITVRASQRRSILFPLGEGRATGGQSSFDQLASLTAIGVKIGLLVALAAVGLSLIYGVANLVNFAHGELVTFGAAMAFLLNASAGGPELPLVLAAVIAVAIGAAGGFLLETTMFAPLRRRRTEGVSLIVFTIGLSLLVRHIFLIFMGGTPRPYADYTLQSAFDVGPISLPPKDYAIAGIAIVVLIGIGVLLERTKIGTGMRAVADNRMLAESSGINVDGIIRFTWVLASGLAALGGVLLGVTEQVVWSMGFGLLLFMFAAVVVGGLGTAYGAMAGGVLVGVVSQVSTYWIDPEYKDAIALGVLILVLIIRPHGILGARERVG